MALTADEELQLIELRQQQLCDLARNSLAAYASMTLDVVPAKHHLLMIRELEKIESGDLDVLILCLPPGSAKALALDTPIPTPNGWTRMGDLEVGDRVFDENGLPCKVTWVSPVWKNRPVYVVRTDCGDEIIADMDHEWPVRLCQKYPVVKLKTTKYLASKIRSKRPMIVRAAALELPECELPLDPYILGYWLGNGTSSAGAVTSWTEDEPWLRSEFARLGYPTTDRSAPGLFGVTDIRKHLVGFGLLNDVAHGVTGRKHIPERYLRASKQQRLALLQGLVDSDGTVCKKRGCTTFSNTNLELAEQFRELVRSLGVKAGWSENRAMLYGKDCGPSYRVSFYLHGSARMPRKAVLTRDQYRTPNTYLDFECVENRDTVCIEVDSPSHLFLCGRSMTPTHNSTYASVAFPAWYLGRHPENCIITASHTVELAERFGRRVRNIVGGEEHKKVFPKAGLSEESTAAGRWDTKQGGEFYACGTGGSVTGRRANCIVMDDILKGREDADSEIIREKQWAWWRDDMTTRLKPNSGVVLVMTRWHQDDLAGRLIEDLKGSNQRYKVLSIPMEAMEDDPLGRQPGEPLWPEWFTPQMLEVAKREPRTWSALYQQQPRPIGGGEFRIDWLNHWKSHPAVLNKVIVVDPASGKSKKRGDFTSMWVIGTGADGNDYVLDGVRDRLNLTERTDKLFELVRRYKPSAVGYEQYGLQADIEHIKGEQERHQYRFRIIELGGATAKVDRIRRLIPVFQQGRIWMPESMMRRMSDGHQRDVMEEFKNEYLSFPVGAHDDALDCLARSQEPEMRQYLTAPKHRQATGNVRPFRVMDSSTGIMG